MTRPESQRSVETGIGLSKSAAVDRLVAADDERDPEFVQTILDHVTEDGHVTETAVDETVTDASMVLSTAETRVELAEIALADARETASEFADIDCVRARLDTFDEQVSSAEDRITDLGATVQSLSGWRDGDSDLYDFVTGLRDVTSDAQQVQRFADDIQTDLEGFERWVSTPEIRQQGLSEDVDALEQSLDGLTRAVEQIQTEPEGGDAPETGDGNSWFDAQLRCRVVSLLIADVRGELEDLREMASRTGADTDGLEDVAGRLDELDARTDSVGARLDAVARPDWTDRYGDRVASFEATLDAFEPPVSWGDVQTALEAHRDE